MARQKIDVIWKRLKEHEGKTFSMARPDEVMRYRISGEKFKPIRNGKNKTHKHTTTKSNVAKALAQMPVSGPSKLLGVWGHSYVWAVLHDKRIRQQDY